jgi:hypothetical protein
MHTTGFPRVTAAQLMDVLKDFPPDAPVIAHINLPTVAVDSPIHAIQMMTPDCRPVLYIDLHDIK